jgi:hypothetical protein
MKVRELIALLQKEDQDAEVRFSESYVSKKVMPGERLSCGPEEGSQILEVMAESTAYDNAETWEDHVVLLGEVLSDVPGLHWAPFEDEAGNQPLTKEVPDPSDSAVKKKAVARRDDGRERRAISVERVPNQKRTRASTVSKAHRQKYESLIRALGDAKKNNVGNVIIAAPWVLGDDYDEIVTNMNLVAKAQMKLCIGTLDIDP